ncbi:thiamine-phosphate pyrophosphorylase [Pustulibacterium marinum]|uniref:Thiamine-phosphate synthase n=1 Tax=Pustulibacterium marinum TaxID=1224947 RepID=A0A1I7FBB5_9FLAO|nr:thiamine phosphate synthase [Pustulibacterium marinum]SFU33490.1 thiamine-phosphate pyrophosphorylase [Pustulibacterium marinum]
MEFSTQLYLVTDSDMASIEGLPEIVEQAVLGGVTMVQLREKHADTKTFVRIAQQLKRILSNYKIPLIINDRIDIALAVDADGVHIGQDDMPYAIARKLLGKDKIIGLSVESMQQVTEANALDVDYIGISPVFATPTKTNTKIEFGLKGIEEISKITKHKTVAIGGINESNTAAIIKAGADGIAVVSAIMKAKNPQLVASQLKQLTL